jgi:hypothetical protein
MKWGDIDGYNKIYYPWGLPILQYDEHIEKYEYLDFGLSRYTISNPDLLFHYFGWMFKTNKRLIGIRRPNPNAQVFTNLPMTGMDRAKERVLRSKGAFEYLIFTAEEIIKAWTFLSLILLDLEISDSEKGNIIIGRPLNKAKNLIWDDLYRSGLVRKPK